MQEPQTNNHKETDDRDSRIAASVIDKAMVLSDSRVDRASFLRRELRVHCTDEQVDDAIELGPAAARIPCERIDKIADSIITSHVRKASLASFAAGIPGGLAMAVTTPADMIQSFRHQIILIQKLAYLYGWPDFLEDGEINEETKDLMTLFLGVANGVDTASRALTLLSKEFAHQVTVRVPKQALTKTIYYPALKTTLKWIGFNLTKKSFASLVAKVIPVAGGVTLTNVVIRRTARKLKNYLRELKFAQPPCNMPPLND